MFCRWKKIVKILTIANRKGGVGKSTCAAHIAYAAVEEGKKVILIDMDPQGTLEKWWAQREEENPYFVEVVNSNVSGVVEKLEAENFDLCIIDTPGDASMNAIEGIKASDLVLIPTKPTPADLSVIGRTICMVEENKKKFVYIYKYNKGRIS
jgi:chromosome partitioning protein